MLLAVAAAPAAASCGGLYKPGLTSTGCAKQRLVQQQSYFKALRTNVSGAALREGTFRAGLVPTREAGPARRAGLGAGSRGLVPLAIVAAVALAAAMFAARRRAPS